MIKLAMIVSFCVATSASAAEFNPTHRIDALEASTGLALKPTADLDQARSGEFLGTQALVSGGHSWA